MILGKQGLIRPFKGLIRLFKGLIWPFKGLLRPLKKLIRPLKSLEIQKPKIRSADEVISESSRELKQQPEETSLKTRWS